MGDRGLSDTAIKSVATLSKICCLIITDCRSITQPAMRALAIGCTQLNCLQLSSCDLQIEHLFPGIVQVGKTFSLNIGKAKNMFTII